MSRESVIEKVSAAKPRKGNGKAPPAPRFRFLTVRELIAAPRPTWTVHEIIPETGLGVIWGASSSGKTFAALDLACAVVLGIPWHGRAVEQGIVLYIASEGRLALRLEAYMQHHQIDADELAGLRVLESRINLLNPDADLPALLESIQAAELSAAKLVIIDTFNRAMPGGNENASEDMGRMVDAAGFIMRTTCGVVVYIHHAGKDDSKGSRGHSSLKAAADFELSVRRDGDVRTLEVEKVRDAEDGYTLAAFTLIPVADSVVPSPTETPKKKVKPVKLSNSEEIALDTLHETLKDRDSRREASADLIEHGAKQGQYVAALEDWRQRLYARLGSDSKADARKKTFQRARDGLQAKRRVQIHDDFAWLP